jgi:cholesterol transport system auxiliary component
MRRRWLLGGAVGTAFATALGGVGCSVLPTQPYLDRRDWPLVVRRSGDSAGDVTGASPAGAAVPSRRGRAAGQVLLVRTVQAAPGMEMRGLQTLQQDGSVKTDFYEQWTVPPAEAVDDDLRQWLADSGLFATVVGPGSRITADFALEGELLALHADLATMTAQAALSLVLIDLRPGAASIGFERTEAASVKLEGTDPPALVQAQRAAVAAMLRQTAADLGNALHP